MCIMKGAFDEGVEAIEKHLKDVQKFDRASFEKDSFYFQYFYIYFGIEDFEQSLDYLNEWLNLPKSIDRQDLQSLARVLNLIVHYELGNSLLVDSLLRSAYRFLNNSESYFNHRATAL